MSRPLIESAGRIHNFASNTIASSMLSAMESRCSGHGSMVSEAVARFARQVRRNVYGQRVNLPMPIQSLQLG